MILIVISEFILCEFIVTSIITFTNRDRQTEEQFRCYITGPMPDGKYFILLYSLHKPFPFLDLYPFLELCYYPLMCCC